MGAGSEEAVTAPLDLAAIKARADDGWPFPNSVYADVRQAKRDVESLFAEIERLQAEAYRLHREMTERANRRD